MALSDINLPSWSSNPRQYPTTGSNRFAVQDDSLHDMTLTMKDVEFLWHECMTTFVRSQYNSTLTSAQLDVLRHCPSDLRLRINHDIRQDCYLVQVRTLSYSNQTVISRGYLETMDPQMGKEVIAGIQRTLIEQIFEKTAQDLARDVLGAMSAPKYLPLDFEDARRLLGDDLNLDKNMVTEPTRQEKRNAASSAARMVKTRG